MKLKKIIFLFLVATRLILWFSLEFVLWVVHGWFSQKVPCVPEKNIKALTIGYSYECLCEAHCFMGISSPKWKWKSNQKSYLTSCLTFCDPMDHTVHGILQARILEWVAFPFSRGFSQPRDQTQVSCIAGGFFTSWATREAQEYWSG